jgi:hypothetical protein
VVRLTVDLQRKWPFRSAANEVNPTSPTGPVQERVLRFDGCDSFTEYWVQELVHKEPLRLLRNTTPELFIELMQVHALAIHLKLTFESTCDPRIPAHGMLPHERVKNG